jgi:hypothetical protein
MVTLITVVMMIMEHTVDHIMDMVDVEHMVMVGVQVAEETELSL